MDGPVGSGAFTDSGPLGISVTSTLEVLHSDVWSVAGQSAEFYGGGGILGLGNPSAFTFGTGDFCIEWHGRPSAGLGEVVIYDARGAYQNGQFVTIGLTSSEIFLYTSSSVAIIGAHGVAAGESAHFALSRVGGQSRLFVRGVQVGETVADSSNYGVGVDRPIIGANGFDIGLGRYLGFIDEMRITKGNGRYSSNFTPPTGPFPASSAGNYEAIAAAASPLGNQSAVAAALVASIAAAASPLGSQYAMGAAQVSCVVAAASPLGLSYALAALASSRSSVESPLTPAIVRAVMGGRALAAVPSMLSSASALVNHDFTVALGDVTARYLLDLVTPGGLVRAPISSWQGTLQTGAKCYVQAVVPASTLYADAINAASEFVISRAAVLPSGMAVEQEMARSPVGSAQFDRGAMRETCTISGYADGFAESTNPPAEYDRTLANIRSMSSGSGGMRVRCAVDWLLRPGQRAFANGVPMIADYINYYAPTGGDSYMDVGERA